jgi:S-adenosylmethionine:tRNA ribosyltransferase-isomerase
MEDAYRLESYTYELPPDLVAQVPARQRDGSRLMVLDKTNGTTAHRMFTDLPGLLREGDLLVVNDTRVLRARLFGVKETGGRVEALILDYTEGAAREAETGVFTSECLVRAAKRPRPGMSILFDGGLLARVVEAREKTLVLAFQSGGDMAGHLARHGSVPLPPYISRENGAPGGVDDPSSYQTVYAVRDGAVAAPTAGLHFTPELLAALEARGITRVSVTLHVGYGTFVPMSAPDVRDHAMHGEWVEVGETTARAVAAARAQGRRVVAAGTTSLRSLEWASAETGEARAAKGMCRLYITPGYRFRTVDALVTNFHLPRSTLLVLVSALAGRERVLAAYQEAVRERYRFFSYGDAMLVA